MRWLLVMVGFLVASRAVQAFGQPLSRPVSPEACDHLDRGNKLYNIGSFDDAITEYKAGALIEPAPVFDYNLGQSHRQLGKYREALWHYDRFLHNGQPTGELRDAVVAFMAEMRAHIENKAQSMPPTGPAPTPEITSMDTSASTHQPGRDRTDIHTSPIHADHNDARDWVGWGCTGSGLIALGISGVLFYRASQLNSEGDAEMEMRARQSLYDQASSRNLAGAVVGIGGAALTAVGVIRLTLHDHSPAPSTAINIGITSRGVFAAGSF